MPTSADIRCSMAANTGAAAVEPVNSIDVYLSGVSRSSAELSESTEAISASERKFGRYCIGGIGGIDRYWRQTPSATATMAAAVPAAANFEQEGVWCRALLLGFGFFGGMIVVCCVVASCTKT